MFTSNQHNDPEKAKRIAHLVAGYKQNILTPQELDELEEWIGASDENLLLFEEMTNKDGSVELLKKALTHGNYPPPRQNLIEQGSKKMEKKWLYLTIATTIPIIIIIILLVKSNSHESILNNNISEINKKLDNLHQPITDKQSDSAKKKTQKIDTIADWNKKIGSSKNVVRAKLLRRHEYDTFVVAKDEDRTLILPGGVKVNLKSSSYIQFSMVSKDADRKVIISGEASFSSFSFIEPSKELNESFSVTVRDWCTINALGRNFRFTVIARNEATVAKIKVFEGKVVLSVSGRMMSISPGQEVEVANPTIKMNFTSAAIPPKEGTIEFAKVDLSAFLNEISKWYNLNIVYDPSFPPNISGKMFSGRLSNKWPVSELLSLMKSFTNLDFRIEGNSLIVSQQ